MRVAHVCPFIGEQMGGSERYVLNISRRQSLNHDIQIYSTTQNYEKAGVKSLRGISFHRSYSPVVFWNINPLSMMLRSLVNSSADIYHIHSYIYFLSNQAVLAKLLTKRRVVLQIHGGVGPPPYRTSWIHFLAKILYDKSLGKYTIKKSDFVSSVSRADLAWIGSNYNIPNERLRYVPNVVNTDMFKPTSNSSRSGNTILYVGDLEPWKGIGSLLDWVRSPNHWKGYNLKIRFVGQGTLLPKLLDISHQCEANDWPIQLEVLGQIKHEELPAIMNNARALILPSHWEGMPTVILEAMSSGTPVITTPVGDIPNLITNMETGLIISRNIESFKEAIDLVLNDDSVVEEITKKARRLIEKEYSLESVHKVILDLYEEVLTSQ
jgi:glycosyltransferase involved in cell wall biosynthesis